MTYPHIAYLKSFDPRATLDNQRLITTNKLKNFHDKIGKIFFKISCYLSFKRNTREIKLKLLELSDNEINLNRFLIESIKSGNSTLEDKVFTHEHEFFNTLGRLAKDLNLNKSYPDRPFSSEMLLPIHALNKGFIALNQYTNEKVCQDLGELKNYGFQRLNYKFYLEMTQYWTYYDDHFQFHEQIDHSAQKLIRSTRLLRKEIYSITHDWRSAFRSDFTKLLKEPLGNFEKDWSDYTQSHKLLKEVNNIYIKSDYFDEYHRLRLRNYFIEDTFDKAVTALDKELPIHLKG